MDLARVAGALVALMFAFNIACITCTPKQEALRPAPQPLVDATKLPYDAFVFLRNEIFVEGECPKGKLLKCPPKKVQYIASGFIIKRSEVFPEMAFVLTARHFCSFDKDDDDVRGKKLVAMVIFGFDSHGKRHLLKQMMTSKEADLCILMMQDSTDLPAVELASVMPPRGSRLFNIGAPGGIYEPEAIPTFDGFYAGMTNDPQMMMTTIPALGGSSGSPVFNASGQVVGLMCSIPMHDDGNGNTVQVMENISFVVPLAPIRNIYNVLLEKDDAVKIGILMSATPPIPTTSTSTRSKK